MSQNEVHLQLHSILSSIVILVLRKSSLAYESSRVPHEFSRTRFTRRTPENQEEVSLGRNLKLLASLVHHPRWGDVRRDPVEKRRVPKYALLLRPRVLPHVRVPVILLRAEDPPLDERFHAAPHSVREEREVD